MRKILRPGRKLLLFGYLAALAAVFLAARLGSLAATRENMLWHLETFGFLPHNYVPFATIKLYLGRLPDAVALRNLLGNLLVLLPFGALLPWSFAGCRRTGRFLAVSALFCAGLEVFQRLTLTGSFDVDDILLNFAGCCAGFLAYRLAGALGRAREGG